MIIRKRKEYEKLEEEILSPLARKSGSSRGRAYPEKEHDYRTVFQRDRDRIIHSRSFRRLMYKTQVFINHEGDHYRTRYTHSMEVAQIARNIARTLCLNEDLTEAIALAHDVGHAPFGHSGEKALDKLMEDVGGFEHNKQSLRIVEELEKKYPYFNGLNLTWEVKEGIIKHSTSYDHPGSLEYEPQRSASMEAQVVDLADLIAYNTHDIDDGLASYVISDKELQNIELWDMVSSRVEKKFSTIDPEIKTFFAIRSLINYLVTDAIHATSEKIRHLELTSVEEVLNSPVNVVCFSSDTAHRIKELESFLLSRFYCHEKILLISQMTDTIIKDLFYIYESNSELLPASTRAKCRKYSLKQVVCDYLAGMTDRFALTEHQRLVGKKYKQLQFANFP